MIKRERDRRLRCTYILVAYRYQTFSSLRYPAKEMKIDRLKPDA